MSPFLIRQLLFTMGFGSLIGTSITTSAPRLQSFLFVAWIIFWSLAVMIDLFHEGLGTARRIAKHVMNAGIIAVWAIYIFGGSIEWQFWLTVVTALAAMFYLFSLSSAFIYSLVDPDYYREPRK